jgi:hypothetical protein
MAPQHSVSLLGRGTLRKKIEFESHPQLAKKYRLLSTDEEKVRKLFTPEMLSYFAANGSSIDWNVEGAGSTLIVYQRGINPKPENFPAFVTETTRVAKSFLIFLD